jgi:hypothetical protein
MEIVMTQLTAVLKKILNGFASADASEYLTAREKAAYLDNIPSGLVQATDPVPVPAQEAVARNKNRRYVAMYLGSELPAAMMNYVIDTCASLDHDLTVLTFESAAIADALLKPYTERLAEKGITINTAKLTGEPIQGLARYIRSHPEVAFMACKDSGYLGRSYLNGTLQKSGLPVPVVVVAAGKASAQMDEGTDKVSKVNAA